MTDLDKALEGMLGEVDRKRFFPILRESFLCQARCCETSQTRQALQPCVGQCGQRVEAVQHAMDAELQNFQQRLQRCAMQCQDAAKDTLPANPSQQQISRAQEQAMKCAESCAGDMVKSLPKLKERLEAAFR